MLRAIEADIVHASADDESQDDVGRSLSQDQKREAKTESKKGEGDRGDRKSS